ncbi:MAG TPA: polysaccharide deacetylase family protein [Candidatus Acidoferrales bacterium]|nr:polysaccharide deacetylase family protein [Candidatus Acidoferrales bacterium]
MSPREINPDGLHERRNRRSWPIPLGFELAKLVGPRYALRCLLFHDVADEVSEFTDGLGVTLGVPGFEALIRFVSRYYTAITLEDYLGFQASGKFPPRPVLITFDDAYASVASNAAPILKEYGVPAVFFVTASLVGNEELGLDNLLCYVTNRFGFEAVQAVGRQFSSERREFESLEQVFDDLLPAMSRERIRQLRTALAAAAGVSTRELAQKAQLYVNAGQLRALTQNGFEIGNHTFSHVFCRTLCPNEFHDEIDLNKATLETITGSRVRAFSVPYGSPVDLTSELVENLRRSGHELVFLARDRPNPPQTDPFHLNRVNMHSGTERDFFAEIELLPRLRSLVDILLRRRQGRNGLPNHMYLA